MLKVRGLLQFRRMSSAGKDQASLTGGHVQYVKGVAEVRHREHFCSISQGCSQDIQGSQRPE